MMSNNDKIIQTFDRISRYATTIIGDSNEGPYDTHRCDFFAGNGRNCKAQSHQSYCIHEATTFGGDGPPYLDLSSPRDRGPPDKDNNGPTYIILSPPHDMEPPDTDINDGKSPRSPGVPPSNIVVTPERKPPDKQDNTFYSKCANNNIVHNTVTPDNNNTSIHVRPSSNDTTNNEMDCYVDNSNHAANYDVAPSGIDSFNLVKHHHI